MNTKVTYSIRINNPLPNPVKVTVTRLPVHGGVLNHPATWRTVRTIAPGMSEEVEVPEPSDYDVEVEIYSKLQSGQLLGQGSYKTVGHQEVKVKEPLKEAEPILSLAEMMEQFDKEAQKI